MTDKELLELAAKAAGFLGFYRDQTIFVKGIYLYPDNKFWNPLTDDGDALRLAVKLDLFWENMELFDIQIMGMLKNPENVRRAIVKAAAEIGKTL